MAGSLNKVILIGNLGRDPEVRMTQGGQKIANLNVATSESWTDKASGQRSEKTEWHRVVMFGNVAGIAESYLKKGSKAYFEGRLQTRKWIDKDNREQYTTEIVADQLVMLDGLKSAEEDKPGITMGKPKVISEDPPFDDDDLPFI